MATTLLQANPQSQGAGNTTGVGNPGGNAATVASGGASVLVSGTTAGPQYGWPYIRFAPSSGMSGTNVVVDLVLQGGLNNQSGWYCVSYTMSSGALS